MSEPKSLSEVSTYSKDTPVGRPDIDGRAGAVSYTHLTLPTKA